MSCNTSLNSSPQTQGTQKFKSGVFKVEGERRIMTEKYFVESELFFKEARSQFLESCKQETTSFCKFFWRRNKVKKQHF